MMVQSESKVEFDALGSELTQSFAKNGVTCIRGLVDDAGVEHLRKWLEIAIANPIDSNQPAGTYIRETRLSSRFEGFREFALNSRCGEAAAAVMGSKEVRLFNDTIFVKEPSAPEPTPWHQDQQNFNLGGFENCAIWIALDPVNQASGGMSYVAGSHRWGKVFTNYANTTDDFDGPAPDVEADPERYPVVSFDLEPGDAVFHHLLTLHKAGPNTTKNTRRRAYSIRFAGDGSTWVDRAWTTAKFNNTLNHGDLLMGDEFPLLWPRHA